MLNHLSRLRIFILFLCSGLLTACFIDDDNNAVEAMMPEPVDPPPAETIDNMVSGSVIKGPVDGALVIIYEFDGTTEIGRGETGDDGSFTISIGENAGGVVISASGGTYTDEATGAENVQFGSVEMRAAYMIPESMTPPFEATINVTPFTELAVREATVNGAIDAQMLASVNEDFFDLGDNAINILTTIPTDPLTESVSEGTAEDLYGLYLAMISQIVSDEGFGSWDEAVDILEVTENADTILSAALNALAASDTAAGANITLEAALSALEAIADAMTDGGDSGDSGDGSDGSGGDGSGGDSDPEAAAGLELVQLYAGTYDVTATIGTHMSGSVTISADGTSIDFDTGISLSVEAANVFNRIPNFPDEPRVQIEFPGDTQQRIRIFVDPNDTGTVTSITYDDDANDSVEPTVAVDVGSGNSSASMMPCVVGEGAETTVPSGLAGTVGDLTITFVAASSPLTEGTVTNFTFSSSGFLFLDNSQVASTPYVCGGNMSEILWFDEVNDRVYAVSFRADGTFNEVNVNSGDGTFLGQYTDENGDFANVTNTDDSDASGQRLCFSGNASETTTPASVAGRSGLLDVVFVDAAVTNLAVGDDTEIIFGNDGALTVGGTLISSDPYFCGSFTTPIIWYDASNDRVYSVPFNGDTLLGLDVQKGADAELEIKYQDNDNSFAPGAGSGIDGGSSGTGDFTLTITGTVAVTTAGVSVAVDIPEIMINNIAAPDANDDFKTILEESDFNVTGEVTVTTINNTENRVTFNLKFEGLNAGVASTYDVTYDYQK